MDIVRKILRTTVVLGSISVNPHFTIHCSNGSALQLFLSNRTGRGQRPKVIADDSYALAVMLSFYCTQTQTHVKLTIWIFTWIFFLFSPDCRPLASAARCGPHSPRYATDAVPGNRPGMGDWPTQPRPTQPFVLTGSVGKP